MSDDLGVIGTVVGVGGIILADSAALVADATAAVAGVVLLVAGIVAVALSMRREFGTGLSDDAPAWAEDGGGR